MYFCAPRRYAGILAPGHRGKQPAGHRGDFQGIVHQGSGGRNPESQRGRRDFSGKEPTVVIDFTDVYEMNVLRTNIDQDAGFLEAAAQGALGADYQTGNR